MGEKCDYCGDEYSRLSSHYYKNPEHKPSSWDACPDCGERYKRIGSHWLAKPEHRPDLTERQHQVVTGVLMGDGHIKEDTSTSYLQVNITQRQYLEHLDSVFGILSTSNIRIERTAEEVAEATRQSGFSQKATEESCSEIYNWRTRNHPVFNDYRDWYETGSKIFPRDFELTPTVLKHWYCCDGNLNTYENRGTIRIGTVNEIKNKEKLESFFTDQDLPCPSWDTNQMWFDCDKSDTLFSYMGDPVPGFEYKWSDRHK